MQKKPGDLRKTITMLLAPGKSATGHSSCEEADKHAIISYKFENEGCMIEPSKKLRIYPCIREDLKRKIEQSHRKKLLIKY